ncbi:hypothetical protein EJ03DRAFT_71529 [Teratosphaeria nubilosa]|uniref:Peptidase S33 tripeptidyl aminopeptidase-like C-terminal domain-containing protein n=1 Tax=Teratosphaeria nubilosa TaxID=161662 RepID=A0A6G1LMR1_9PEZI|nr:hypothetical protein EJ03DRAFT_71529 [Teratosphaeria nubilosa]
MEEGVFEASDAALGRLWSMGVARGKSCALPPADGEQDIRRYVTTASVARDMLEIVEIHGRWREREALQLLSHAEKSCHSRRLSTTPQAKPVIEVPKQLRYKPGEERLQYWGFSYGTYLGNTFANAVHSNCTVSYIRQYFQTGELPPPNTTCAADELPFGPSSSDEVMSVEASKARERTAIINEALQEYGGWL